MKPLTQSKRRKKQPRTHFDHMLEQAGRPPLYTREEEEQVFLKIRHLREKMLETPHLKKLLAQDNRKQGFHYSYIGRIIKNEPPKGKKRPPYPRALVQRARKLGKLYEDVIYHNLRLIKSRVQKAQTNKSATRQTGLKNDLFQEGYIILNRAIDKYDLDYRNEEGQKVRFATYAARHIDQRIRNFKKTKLKTVAISEREINNNSKIQQAINTLKSKGNLTPTHADIAAESQLKIKTVAKTLQQTRNTFSVDAPMKSGEDGSWAASIPDHNIPAPIEGAIHIKHQEQIDLLLRGLLPRERLIIELRQGLNGDEPKTLKETSAILKQHGHPSTTSEHIRQIQEEAHKKLSRRSKVLTELAVLYTKEFEDWFRSSSTSDSPPAEKQRECAVALHYLRSESSLVSIRKEMGSFHKSVLRRGLCNNAIDFPKLEDDLGIAMDWSQRSHQEKLRINRNILRRAYLERFFETGNKLSQHHDRYFKRIMGWTPEEFAALEPEKQEKPATATNNNDEEILTSKAFQAWVMGHFSKPRKKAINQTAHLTYQIIATRQSLTDITDTSKIEIPLTKARKGFETTLRIPASLMKRKSTIKEEDREKIRQFLLNRFKTETQRTSSPSQSKSSQSNGFTRKALIANAIKAAEEFNNRAANGTNTQTYTRPPAPEKNAHQSANRKRRDLNSATPLVSAP